MHGIGVAEEVVHVAEYLLVGSYEEHAQVVRLALLERVHGQHMLYMSVAHEVGYLAVAVARYVLQRGVACGALGEPLYGHDGEELVYGPAVGQ